jgi:soluble lytic murein transglycosylase-like protein
MPPVNRARRRALRAMMSALAGGGLTAAGLGGPLTGAALGATGTTGAQSSAEAGAGIQEGETGQSTTGTSTTPTTSSTPTETPTETTTGTSTTAPPSAAPTSTTPQASPPAPAAPEAPTVVLKRKQKATASAPSNPSQTTTTASGEAAKPTKHSEKATGPNNVASSPQMVAAEAGALAAVLASAEASDQALAFYRIPLFLLPIYKAAAVQYGVPWQILAAINEIETDYGTDQSVSTAGAVGWMQFEPSTWLQYGVDALNAGYADPYNPVDAIFAAARYLRAAGAGTDLRAAILAYNHSEEYVDSVLLRAKLISTYPKAVIATLTGLIDGRPPVTGKRLSWSPLPASSVAASSATAGASALPSVAGAPGTTASAGTTAGAAPATGAPGSSPPPSPTAAAAAATPAAAKSAAQALQLVELMSSPNASVVAVQDGRILQIGDSRKLGKYVVLRDVYGDVFTYAGLGSIAPSYLLPKLPSVRAKSPVVEAASTRDPAPSQPASAGTQSPLTLSVKTPRAPAQSTHGQISLPLSTQEAAPAGMDRVRLFAHPGNPDARAAAAAASAARKARNSSAGQRLPLRKGSVVASGTVLGRVSVPPGATDGHLRFAIRPAGDTETINPGAILANWAQLQTALHPQGAKAINALLGATASDVFLLSKAQLERAVLSDPGITLDACGRHDVASGMVDKRVLAVLAFLSRSGLEPTVSVLSCSASQNPAPSSANAGEAVDISAINGTPIAGHQGPETITDLTIRALLTLPAGFVPHEIVSLMRYPGSSNTHSSSADWNRIHLEFLPPAATATLNPAAATRVAHSASSGRTAPAPIVTTSPLSAAQWTQLMQRVAALPAPTIVTKPSSAAIPDPKKHR